MAALSKRFTVTLADPSSSTSRAAKRIVVNSELLRNAKVAAGDVLSISASNSQNAVRCLIFGFKPQKEAEIS